MGLWRRRRRNSTKASLNMKDFLTGVEGTMLKNISKTFLKCEQSTPETQDRIATSSISQDSAAVP